LKDPLQQFNEQNEGVRRISNGPLVVLEVFLMNEASSYLDVLGSLKYLSIFENFLFFYIEHSTAVSLRTCYPNSHA